MADKSECAKENTFNFYSFFFPPKDLDIKKEKSEEVLEDVYHMESKSKKGYLFYTIILFYSIYLSFKCNNGFNPPDLLMAVTFPVCYVFYKVGTDFESCFPEINLEPRTSIKILE